MRLLQGQNVIVVGGSRGVGRSIAEAALSEGATVLAVARSEQTLADLARETTSVKALAVDATVESAP
nr:SDR family NAD(P)-dependent oxidoreductase [Mesorhizobium sp.]